MPVAPLWSHKFELKPEKWVFVPSAFGRASGNAIVLHVKDRWRIPAHFAHFRKGGHVLALKGHLKHDWFIKTDISNFFTSINRTRVTRTVKKYSDNFSEARDIANHSVVKHPVNGTYILPYGFVQSPLIASLCLDKSALGTYLRKLEGAGNVKVTVYMDDIVISGPRAVDGTKIMDQLRERANRSGFTLNLSKTVGPVPQIEVFNIEISHHHIKLTDVRIDGFADLLASNSSSYVLDGVTGYVKSVNPSQVQLVIP